jgi:phosphatidate cytidylyltransferase
VTVPDLLPRGKSNNLQIRIASAVFLGAIAIAATWYGGMPFRALAALAGILVYWEWQSITGDRKYGLLDLAAPAAVAASMVFVILGMSPLQSMIPAAFAAMFAVAACKRRGAPYWMPLGVPYSILPALGLTALRGDSQNGIHAIVFLFAVVWATDVFAYFVGRAAGGAKLAPKISPNKTWSGSIGGSVAGVIAGLCVAAALGQSNWVFLGGIALLLSVVAQVGDLFESHVKRRFGVKDSGTIIPGHGGVMDRVDGLVAAIVALYLVCIILGYPQSPALALFP